LCRSGEKKKEKEKKRKGLFLPCAAKLTRAPLGPGFLVPHGHPNLTLTARSFPFSVD